MSFQLTPVERVFASLNLTTPSSRFLAVATATAALIYAAEPDFAFIDGYARPFVAFDDGESRIEPTVLPWWLVAVGAATVSSTFV